MDIFRSKGRDSYMKLDDDFDSQDISQPLEDKEEDKIRDTTTQRRRSFGDHREDSMKSLKKISKKHTTSETTESASDKYHTPFELWEFYIIFILMSF